jgi:hypothetical protein
MILELSGGIAFMNREEALTRWKPIIDGYQAGTKTVLEYCKRLNVSVRMYYHYRRALYGHPGKAIPRKSDFFQSSQLFLNKLRYR